MMAIGKNPYFKLLRVNHWFKNFFILFGVAAALWVTKVPFNLVLIIKIMGAFLLASFVSSANYIINQIADREFDKKHPLKKYRPIPSGQVAIELPFFLSIVIFLITFGLAMYFYEFNFTVLIFIFWIAGILYNIKPLRLKDVPYVDVISESANNPIRFLIGWFVLKPFVLPPAELLFFAWAAGAVLMTAKRYDELYHHGEDLIPYRHTFGTYSLKSLRNLLAVYALASFGFFFYFISQHQTELVWITPLILIYLLWLLRAIITGRAQARNVEHFVLTKQFLIISLGLLALTIATMYIV